MSSGLDRRALIAGAAALTIAARRPSTRDRALALWRTSTVIDGNLVTPLDPDDGLSEAIARQVRASGLTAFKLSLGGSGAAFADVEAEIDAVDRAMARDAQLFMKVRSAADLDAAKQAESIGVIYSFESVEMLEGGLSRIEHFARRGVRVMQLSYNGVSPFASGVMAPQPSAGLTPLGRDAVVRMQDLGITLDLSHSDERSTLEAAAAAKKPVVITHAGCAAVHPHPRNKTDEVLRIVARSGGVVGIFELSYLSAGPRQQSLDDYMAHLLHALKVCGEDHVGIGSDAQLTAFDTSAANMKEWAAQIAARKAAGVAAPGEGRPPFVSGLNRPDRTLVIAEALLAQGQPERVARKVLGSNFQRVFGETWA